MSLSGGVRTVLATLAAVLFAVLTGLVAHAHAEVPSAPVSTTVASPDGSSTLTTTIVPSRLAYATSSDAQPESMVWVAAVDGSSPLKLGPGFQPLVSPAGASVAAGLFGPSETGPSLALYPAVGGTPQTFGDLSHQTAYPLAWSPDSRYVAVALQSTAVKNVAAHSGLAMLDTTTGTLKTIAAGVIYGASFAPDGTDHVVFARSRSQNFTAPVNLYTAFATGAGLTRMTSDGHSLNPVWGPKSIAYDRERLRRNDAPVYQIWLRRASGGSPRTTDLDPRAHARLRARAAGLLLLGQPPVRRVRGPGHERSLDGSGAFRTSPAGAGQTTAGRRQRDLTRRLAAARLRGRLRGAREQRLGLHRPLLRGRSEVAGRARRSAELERIERRGVPLRAARRRGSPAPGR